MINIITVGAFAGSRLWRDSFYTYIIYHPVCYGNESNILNCRYNTTNAVSNRCLGSYYADETSVICLPSKKLTVITEVNKQVLYLPKVFCLYGPDVIMINHSE